MSLESGAMLWRLNHVLLPDPGKPMASTTIPFGGRGGAAGTVSGAWGAGAALSPSVGGSAVPSSGVSTLPAAGGPLIAEGAKACATARSRPWPPRPRPPRRRRLRPAEGWPPLRGWERGSEGSFETMSSPAFCCSGAGSACASVVCSAPEVAGSGADSDS